MQRLTSWQRWAWKFLASSDMEGQLHLYPPCRRSIRRSGRSDINLPLRASNLLPKGVIAFPGSGITGNLVDKAEHLGLPVVSVAVAA